MRSSRTAPARPGLPIPRPRARSWPRFTVAASLLTAAVALGDEAPRVAYAPEPDRVDIGPPAARGGARVPGAARAATSDLGAERLELRRSLQLVREQRLDHAPRADVGRERRSEHRPAHEERRDRKPR